MNDRQWQELNARLAGIELPPEPNWWPLVWTVVALAAALLILVVVIRERRKTAPARTPAAAAARRLELLQQAWQNGELAPRDTAYQLATLLRLGLGLRQLDRTPPPQLADQEAEWHALLGVLQQLRYRPDSDTRISARTFSQIRGWLQC